MSWSLSLVSIGLFLSIFFTLSLKKQVQQKVGIENTVLIAERISRVGFASVENEPQVQFFDANTDELSALDDNNDPEFNPSNTPNEWRSGSTPNEWRSGSTPNEWRSGSTPNEWRSGSTPNEWRSGSTPNEWRSGSTPNEWRSGSTPNEWRSGNTPNEWRSGSTPNVPSQSTPHDPSNGNDERVLSLRHSFPMPQVRFLKTSN